jgi:capsular exopolysaccharide synthesis family protein
MKHSKFRHLNSSSSRDAASDDQGAVPGGNTTALDNSVIQSIGGSVDVERFNKENVLTDIRYITNLIWRRKWMLIIPVIVFVVISAVLTGQMTPRYSANSSVMLKSIQSNVLNLDNLISGITTDTATLIGELEVLQSTELLGRVIEKLKLEADPEFNAELAPPSLLGRLKQKFAAERVEWEDGASRFLESLEAWRWVKSQFGELTSEAGLGQDIAAATVEAPRSLSMPSDEEDALHEQIGIVNALRSRMAVENVRGSWIISISVETESPLKSKIIADSIADEYLVDQLEAKYAAAERANAWLHNRLEDLKSDLAASEEAVEKFRVEASLGGDQGAELTQQQLTELSSQLIVARSERATAEALYNQVASALRRGGVDAAASVISSPMIDVLRGQLAETRREMADLSATYGKKHPRISNVVAEIQDVEKDIEAEVQKVVAGLETKAAIARYRESALENNVQKLEEKYTTIGQKSVELLELEREAGVNRLVYEEFLSRFKETQEQQSIQEPDARVISYAEIPTVRSYPRRTRIALLSGMAGLFLGLILIALAEKLDNVYRTPFQIRHDLNLRTLSIVPLVRRIKNRKDLLRFSIENPNSALSEAVTSLRTAIFSSKLGRVPPRVVAVMSSVPGEGKSTTAALLAQSLVRIGNTVLLIDCDMRRPALKTAFDVTGELNLAELLASDAELADVVRVDDASGVHVIHSAVATKGGNDMLATKDFEQVIQHLKFSYDVVILDTAPVMAVSDALIIGKHVESIIYSIKWHSTPRGVVKSCIRNLVEAGLSIDGVVLSQVDMKKHATYGYYDQGYYHKEYKNYYHEKPKAKAI